MIQPHRYDANDQHDSFEYYEPSEVKALIRAADGLCVALASLQRGSGCWCEMAIGNPMVTNHSTYCHETKRTLQAYRVASGGR